MIKVLMAAAEAAPFIKTGGLGDVLGSLPKALMRLGADVRVVIPWYDGINDGYKSNSKQLAEFEVRLGWRKQNSIIRKCMSDNTIYYFIDNSYYFKRPCVYQFYDEAERYTFFCRAALEMLPQINFKPDIIHCHDWHAGLIPLYIKDRYAKDEYFSQIKTLFTIHNLSYQGIFDKSILYDFMELDDRYFTSDGIEFYGKVNFMKAALVYADLINTVSETYAKEIQYPYYGEKLDGVLSLRKNCLTGIINGIDFKEYNPFTDKNIINYHKRALKKRIENKLLLQQTANLQQDSCKCVLAVISRLVEAKGMDLIMHIADELLLNENLQLVVLGTGEQKYEKYFSKLEKKHQGRVKNFTLFSEELSRKIYAGSDMLIMPSRFEPCGISQLIAMRYGCIPIVRETGGLKDTVIHFDTDTCQGNGFKFCNYNAHELLFTIKNALLVYQDKYKWNKLIYNAMSANYSWQQSAHKYRELYEMLIGTEGADV